MIGPPYDMPFGRMAALRDTLGATFMVTEPLSQQQPDRSG